MTDVYTTVKDFLAADAGVAALATGGVFIDVALPQGYQIADGPALVLHPTGGISPFYAVNSDMMMFVSYANTGETAIALNEALWAAMRRTASPNSGLSFYAQPLIRGRLLRPEGKLFLMLASYNVSEVV